MELSENPDKKVRYRPARCGCCGKSLKNAPVQYSSRIMGTGIYLWHGQFLPRDRACQALSDMFGCAPSPGALAAAAKQAAGFLAPALAAITRHLIACEVVHFDETGFRAAGKLAWVHSVSQGKRPSPGRERAARCHAGDGVGLSRGHRLLRCGGPRCGRSSAGSREPGRDGR
jgi:hypothetical protein